MTGLRGGKGVSQELGTLSLCQIKALQEILNWPVQLCFQPLFHLGSTKGPEQNNLAFNFILSENKQTNKQTTLLFRFLLHGE